MAEKHVIFLGAGASSSSGYPLASELRLLLSSRDHFSQWIYNCFPNVSDVASMASEYFKLVEPAVKIFREGGFATVDEFCKLNSGQKKLVETSNMRYFTRLVLGALNPEIKFEKSEYYPLVQRLFDKDLANLRSDISILSFNYDPYLEFLIWRAWARRNGKAPSIDLANHITSGFFDHENTHWADSPNSQFCLLKLHGSICEFRNPSFSNISTLLLFGEDSIKKRNALFDPDNRGHTPPILFPWEILNADYSFRSNDFPIQNDQYYFQLFVKIWERARKEVQSADKISFVGLSMHEYLNLGFRYLFQGMTKPIQTVVANKLNDRFRDGYRKNEPLHPNSPSRKLFELLKEMPNSAINCIYSKQEPQPTAMGPNNKGQEITARYTFTDFIEHEV